MADTPYGSVVQGSNGLFYGTTFEGGARGQGIIFRVQADGAQFTVLHSFGVEVNDGASPWAGLLAASDGGLYGVTTAGGTDGQGTVFKIEMDGTGYAVLHHFASGTSDGHNPFVALIEGSDGALYGACYRGGTADKGTLFKLNKDGTGYGTLYQFSGGKNDGENPLGALLEGSDGKLYGTTQFGGNEINNDFGVIGLGTVFSIAKSGNSFALLYKFSKNGNDGRHPTARLIEGADGRLYGTTAEGGNVDADGFMYGTVFRLNRAGSGYEVLHRFLTLNDGQNPSGGLVQASDGLLYGTTEFDDPAFAGAIFSLNLDGSGYAVRFRFDGSNGEAPAATLTEGSDGRLYGTTTRGGLANAGVFFNFDPASDTQTLLHSFSPGGGDPANPDSSLVEGPDGFLYGVSRNGGSGNAGTIWKMNKAGGDFTLLYSFQNNGIDGRQPRGRLLPGSDGVMYGTTFYGGTNVGGTLFRINPDGSGYAILHHFSGAGGQSKNPAAGLIEGSDGFLYGASQNGGSSGLYGTLFRIRKDGSGFAVIYNFTLDRRNPTTPLLERDDGYLYGTINFGNRPHIATPGEVYRVRLNGTGYQVLHSFGGAPDGEHPSAELVDPGDGWLYGTTENGGTGDAGTVYRLRPDGSDYSVLHSFAASGAEGQNPTGPLAGDAAGFLHGTTTTGGAHGWGTVFRLQRDGSGFEVLRAFGLNPDEGRQPRAGLAAMSDGNLYGTTSEGGPANLGTVFRYGSSQGADLSVALTATPGPVAVSQPLTYTVTVSNAGPSAATTARLTNFWSGPVGEVTATPSQGSCTIANGVVDCQLGSLDPGSAATISLTAAPAAVGWITNIVRVTGTPADPAAVNNESALAIEVLSLPSITVDPESQTVTNGGTAVFTVQAIGPRLSYQWFHDHLQLPNATSNTLLLPNVSPAQSGAYYVTVSNPVGSAQSASAILTVLEAPTIAPIADQVMDEDASITLDMAISDPETPADELILTAVASNPVLIGASGLLLGGSGTARTLTLTPNTNQHGTAIIMLTVEDADGVTATTSFQLTVNSIPDLPVIGQQPQNLTVVAGAPATFSVSAGGVPNLEYQWRHDAVNLPGQTEATLTIPNAQPADAGSYTVVVTGFDGAVTSQPAQLRVLVPPEIVLVAHTNGQTTFSFLTASDAQYVVEHRSHLDATAWTELATLTGTGAVMSYTDTNAATESRFYRVRVQ